MKPRSFEEAVLLYDRLIKGQIKKLYLSYDFDEFYQCGLIGLWKAYTKFDEKKGHFAAYALYTVRGYLLVQLKRERRYFENHKTWDLIHSEIGSEEVSETFTQYMSLLNKKERYVMEEKFGQTRKLTEIARDMHLTYDQVRYVYARALVKLRKEYFRE